MRLHLGSTVRPNLGGPLATIGIHHTPAGVSRVVIDTLPRECRQDAQRRSPPSGETPAGVSELVTGTTERRSGSMQTGPVAGSRLRRRGGGWSGAESVGCWHHRTMADVDDEELLHGGVANAGSVVRSGDHVLRPSNPHSASIHSVLTQVRSRGFSGASQPVCIDPDGRERLRFVPGEVPLPPYPAWARSDEALASVAVLIRGLHDASVDLDLGGATWSGELADPEGGPVMCHNDVCMENVVFRSGRAVALLDFDFAAPGRRAFDIAACARMCVPIDEEASALKLGWKPIDGPARLRLVCDSYGFDQEGRADVLRCLSESIARGGEFVRRRVEAGEVAFIEMWNNMGGQERFDRRRRWWSERSPDFTEALR